MTRFANGSLGKKKDRYISPSLSLISTCYPDLLAQMKMFEAILYPLPNNQVFPIELMGGLGHCHSSGILQALPEVEAVRIIEGGF